MYCVTDTDKTDHSFQANCAVWQLCAASWRYASALHNSSAIAMTDTDTRNYCAEKRENG